MMLCFKSLFTWKKKSSVLTRCFSYVAESAVLGRGNWAPFEARWWQLPQVHVSGWLATRQVLGSRANRAEYGIIDCSKQGHSCFWIWFFPSFHVGLKMQPNCFQEHPEAICVTRCVVNTLFFIGASFKYVHCRDGEGLDSLRLFTCQLSPAVNGNIYFILEYNLNMKVYSLHFLLIYRER